MITPAVTWQAAILLIGLQAPVVGHALVAPISRHTGVALAPPPLMVTTLGPDLVAVAGWVKRSQLSFYVERQNPCDLPFLAHLRLILQYDTFEPDSFIILDVFICWDESM